MPQPQDAAPRPDPAPPTSIAPIAPDELRLPAAPRPFAAAPASDQAPPPAAQPVEGELLEKTLLRVLLVEDNAGDARLLREYLPPSGTACFEIETVARLSQAMDATRARDFDIVLLDLSLPDGSGLDTYTTLAREAPHLPVVLLTGLNDDALALRAVQAGAQDYLVKGQVNESILSRSLLYAVERHRVQSQLKTLSVQDALTGLYNRRGFLSMAEQHLKTAARESRAMALFYADLDGMKQINDRFGHHEGDWALIKAAEVLRATFREADVLARLGGDEFTVLAWMRSGEDIERVTQRLREHLQAVNEHAHRAFALGISVGAALVRPGEVCSVGELLARADRALYEAKRNKPRSALPDPLPPAS